MKIVLLQRVEKLGLMGEIVNVKTGYARNYLIPTKKALRASKENIAFFFLMPEIRIELFDQYITTEAVALAEKCLTELNRGSWSEESINNKLKTFVKKYFNIKLIFFVIM